MQRNNHKILAYFYVEKMKQINLMSVCYIIPVEQQLQSEFKLGIKYMINMHKGCRKHF